MGNPFSIVVSEYLAIRSYCRKSVTQVCRSEDSLFVVEHVAYNNVTMSLFKFKSEGGFFSSSITQVKGRVSYAYMCQC